MTDTTTTPDTPLDTLEAAYLKQLDELDKDRAFRKAADFFTRYFFHIELDEERQNATALIDLWKFRTDEKTENKNASLDFHNITLYEDCYEWKFDDELREWNIDFNEQNIVQHAIELQEIWQEQVYEKFKDEMKGFVIRDLLVYARAVKHANLYEELKGAADVKKFEKLLDEVLSLETPISMSFDDLGEYAVLSETVKDLKAYIREESAPQPEITITR